MYPHDNIFSIYYNIGKRTPFLVKRCELGLARSSSEERRIDPNQDRTFLVETVKPRGKYGKAYGKCFVNGKPDDTYRQEFPQHNRVEGHIGGIQPKQLPRSGESGEKRNRMPQLHAVRQPAAQQDVRSAHKPVYRRAERLVGGGTRGNDIKNQRGPTVLLQPARHPHRRCCRSYRQRICQRGYEQTADGICLRGTEAIASVA